MSIIAISGKINNGKDVVGDIIRYFTSGADKANISFQDWDKNPVWGTTNNEFHICSWETKKFADKLKDTICLWLGCSREQLEDREFKEKELGEDWWYYITGDGGEILCSYNEYDSRVFDGNGIKPILVKLTPRKLLQLLGTDCGRNIIHPNIWINATMSSYTQHIGYAEGNYTNNCGKCKKDFIGDKRAVRCKDCSTFYPNWLITDCRFPNEAEVVSEKSGITIRVNRPLRFRFPELWKQFKNTKFGEATKEEEPFLTWLRYTDRELYNKLTHESETSLDFYNNFTYIIENDGTFEELIEKVRIILVQEGIL